MHPATCCEGTAQPTSQQSFQTSRPAKPARALSRVGANGLKKRKKRKRNPPSDVQLCAIGRESERKKQRLPEGIVDFCRPICFPLTRQFRTELQVMTTSASVGLSRQDVVMSSSTRLEKPKNNNDNIISDNNGGHKLRSAEGSHFYSHIFFYCFSQGFCTEATRL